MTSDLMITNTTPELLTPVVIFADGVAGEPVERFTVSFTQPLIPVTDDAVFLFRASVINIVDKDSE